ncbi:MAG: hypothetical protein NTV51_11085 [Verrucomicrobia bacterium]|nr:hypothetical protein [Verrucomicrobiota bacterium]
MKRLAISVSSFSLTAAALAGLAAVTFAADVRGQPPAWPDARVVKNGCYVSTAAYLARLRAEHPAVVARAENVRLPNGRWHTIALVEWERRTYLRDLYLGVAPASGDVQRSFDRAVAAWRARGGSHGYRDEALTSAAACRAEVEAAARLLAGEPTQIVAVLSARGPIPVLIWQTAGGECAFYEPNTGTAVGRGATAPGQALGFVAGRCRGGIGDPKPLSRARSPVSIFLRIQLLEGD